ncbi:MAG: J domain-containing protein [Rhodospirillaceae bacterium]|nr:J domain-containing protein [Rhodospirillaceae bacterium]
MPKLEIIDRLVDPGVQLCEWPDCAAEGEHRAPRSRDDMDSYRWFCLEHAREYNKGWNYFAGMSDDEVEADRRADTVWRRPSWPLGDGPPTPEQARAFWRGDFSDPFDALGGKARPDSDRDAASETPVNDDVKRALYIFGMEPPVTVDEVKTRYKALVKRHHPDAGEAEADEDRIKDINQAYKVILSFLMP